MTKIKEFFDGKEFSSDLDTCIVIGFILEFFPALTPDIHYNRESGKYFICFAADKQ